MSNDNGHVDINAIKVTIDRQIAEHDRAIDNDRKTIKELQADISSRSAELVRLRRVANSFTPIRRTRKARAETPAAPKLASVKAAGAKS